MHGLFKLEFEVRDSELDAQGIVNNANYFVYFEHARHKFLQHIGVSFAKMAVEKQLLVLISSQIDFKKALKAEDKFYVTCAFELVGKLKIGCKQEIRRITDNELMTSAYSVIVCIDGNNRNKAYLPDFVKKLK